MIDFPAAPTDGQVFSAPNGVVYKWSATYSSWLAQGPPPVIGGTGEVTAISSGTQSPAFGSDVTVAFGTVQSGNSGLWWNTTTNRYTPPAGKYFLSAIMTMGVGSAGNPATVTCKLRKNGVMVGQPIAVSASLQFSFAVPVAEYVDANGSDYFDVTMNISAASAAGTLISNAVFSAFPLTGIQGPTGGAPGPVVGDFTATWAGSYAVPSTATALVLTTILTGNSGGYYNLANGRYTPPAGRYYIFGQCYINGANATPAGYLYKNGVAVPNVIGAGFNGAGSQTVAIAAVVDANGTDYFEFRVSTNNAATANSAVFGATPTQGMVGPQGPQGPLPAGALSLYQEVLLSANAATMQVSWPSGARKIEIEYFTQNVGNAGDNVTFRAMLNGVPQTATGYANQYVFGTGSTPSAGQTVNQTFWQALAGMVITKGTLKPAVTPTQVFMEHTQVGTSATAGYALEAFHWGGPTGNMNGLQMYNQSGTQFLPSSFLRVYVVP